MRKDYIDWVRDRVDQVAHERYPREPQRARMYAMGVMMAIIGDLMYEDSNNFYRVKAKLDKLR